MLTAIWLRRFQYLFLAIIVTTVGFSLYQWNASRASTQKTAPNNGLVGYWSFNEGTGTQAGDASVNKNTGTLTSGPTWVNGKLGQAVSFDAVDDYVDAGTSSAVMPAFPFTVSTWVMNGGVITTADTANNGEYSGYTIFMYSGGGIDARVGNNAGFCDGSYRNDYSTTATTLNVGQWYHVTVVFTNASSFSIFVNGTSVSVSQSGTNGISIGYAAGARFRIARYFAACGGTTVYSGGNIDEVRIYNRALSGTEITNLYNLGAERLNVSPVSNLTSGLVGYWTFDGKDTPWSSSSAGTATDRSGNGNTGTLTNMSQSTSVLRGQLGQALNFDGTNDYVNTGITSNTNFSNTTFSVSAWFKTTVSAGVIIAKQDSTAGGWAVNFAGSSLSAVHKGTAGGNVLSRTTTATGLNDGNWHHVAFTMTTNTSSSAGQNIDLYLDGALNQGSLTNTAAIVTVANAVYIGDRYNTSIPWNGSIDEVRIYNRALSAGEVQSLYDLGASDKVNSSVSQNQGTGRLDSGLAGYWKLDDASGTTATDSSTNGNNGTLTNGPTWGTGKIRGDVVFDGTNDYIDLGNRSVLNLTNNFSVSVWANINNLTQFDYKRVYGRPEIDTNNRPFYIEYNYTANQYRTVWRNGGIYGSCDGKTLTAVGWQHFVATFKDGVSKCYSDGILMGTASGVVQPISTSSNTYIGDIGMADYFPGSIDEVRVYNRALSSDEVSQLYRLTAPTGVDTSLKGYWSFDGNATNWTSSSAGTVSDLSGSGNIGTLTNMNQSTSVMRGKLGQALSFDGMDDRVDVGDMPSIEGQSAVTFVGWLKPTVLVNWAALISKYVSTTDDITLNAGGPSYSANTALVGSVRNGADTYGYTGTGKLSVGNWTHVAMVFDGVQSGNSNRLKIYVNGVAETLTFNGTIPATTPSNSQNVLIGRTGSASNYWNGAIDDVRIYNRVLSATEVAALYNTGR